MDEQPTAEDAAPLPLAGLGTVDAVRRAARRARQSQDWEGLRQAGAALRALAPESQDGVLMEAAALVRLERKPEAHALMREMKQRFADKTDPETSGHQPASTGQAAVNARSLRAAAGAAAKREDWAGLEQAAKALRLAAPDDVAGYQLGARALRQQRRIQAAEAVSADGVARFADHPGLLMERATILLRLMRVEEAAACFGRLRRVQPDQPLGWVRHADALVRLGRFAEADGLLEDGLDRFPRTVELLAQAALCATRAGDFSAARKRWEQVRLVAPDDIRLRNALGGVDFAEQLQTMPDMRSVPVADPVPAAGGEMDDAAVLRRFESLGGNCEFGLTQRAGGIEPLGLLRFAGITAAELIAMLRAELAGIGAPENTRLTLNINNEYWMEDTRYFRTHTFLTLGSVDEQTLLPKLCRRTAFLRDKLLAELRLGNKIMVFRPADGQIEDATISALHAAVRALGPSMLLCVRDGSSDGPDVTVHDAGDGLFVGAMRASKAKLSLQFVEQQRFELWLRLCRMVLDLVW